LSFIFGELVTKEYTPLNQCASTSFVWFRIWSLICFIWRLIYN